MQSFKYGNKTIAEEGVVSISKELSHEVVNTIVSVLQPDYSEFVVVLLMLLFFSSSSLSS